MKKIILFVFSLSLGIIAVKAQNQKEIVSGTRVSIVPPSGFVKGENFTGYQKGEYAMINVMDLTDGNFYSNAETFTKEKFEAEGRAVFEFEEILIDGYPAKMAKAESAANTTSIFMVFGDSTFSAMLIGVYPSIDNLLGEEIKKSILSASYKKGLDLDPFASAFFSLDDSESKLKFLQANANMFAYTVDGDGDNTEGKPMMLVYPLPNDASTTPKKTSETIIAALQGEGLRNVQYISRGNTIINGYEAYELHATGEMNGTYLNIFVQTIINGDNQLIIQGLQNGGSFDPEDIRELSKTVKMK